MYQFKYMQDDNTIYRNNSYYSTFAEFKALYPDFPIVEGEFFEFKEDGNFEKINEQGHHFPQKELTPYQDLITAINNLE